MIVNTSNINITVKNLNEIIVENNKKNNNNIDPLFSLDIVIQDKKIDFTNNLESFVKIPSEIVDKCLCNLEMIPQIETIVMEPLFREESANYILLLYKY